MQDTFDIHKWKTYQMFLNESDDDFKFTDTDKDLAAGLNTVELKVGDYIIGEIAIERKTLSDFISSMLSRRLLEQLNQLSQSKKPILILEGQNTNNLEKETKDTKLRKWEEQNRKLKGLGVSRLFLKHKVIVFLVSMNSVFNGYSQSQILFGYVLSHISVYHSYGYGYFGYSSRYFAFRQTTCCATYHPNLKNNLIPLIGYIKGTRLFI